MTNEIEQLHYQKILQEAEQAILAAQDDIELQIKSQARERECANAPQHHFSITMQPQLTAQADTILNGSEKNFGG